MLIECEQAFKVPLQVQSQIFRLLALTSWASSPLYYGSIEYTCTRQVWTAFRLSARIGAFFGGYQLQLVPNLLYEAESQSAKFETL